MATVTITMRTDNEAFTDNPGAECARILRRAADWIACQATWTDGDSFPLMDLNGNRVGKLTIGE